MDGVSVYWLSVFQICLCASSVSRQAARKMEERSVKFPLSGAILCVISKVNDWLSRVHHTGPNGRVCTNTYLITDNNMKMVFEFIITNKNVILRKINKHVCRIQITCN